ncbi:MAG TPA: hypothetical protein VF503_32540 [Sphingobium sp.]|uniref:hypothetical protein n=1 Tax=Sphingobium sp. TaxID=1912891 RepID=UPI002ED1D965
MAASISSTSISASPLRGSPAKSALIATNAAPSPCVDGPDMVQYLVMMTGDHYLMETPTGGTVIAYALPGSETGPRIITRAFGGDGVPRRTG